MHDRIQEIGIVKNRFKEPADPYEIRRWESIIVIHETFEDGLDRIEEFPGRGVKGRSEVVSDRPSARIHIAETSKGTHRVRLDESCMFLADQANADDR
jgi:hypothetical protein